MMVGFRYKQQLPLIRLYSVYRVQALSNWSVILEQVLSLLLPLMPDWRFFSLI